MKINFSEKSRNLQKQIGFESNQSGNVFANPDSEFELPCGIADADLNYRIRIGAYSYIGNGFKNYSDVKIGRFCSIAENVALGFEEHPLDRMSTSPIFYDSSFNPHWRQKIPAKFFKDFNPRGNEVVIGNDVWIGYGVRIMGGVTIGNGAVIGAGAIVTKDVPDYAIVVGIPAKKISERKVQMDFYEEFPIWDKIKISDLPQFVSSSKKIKSLFKKK